MIRIVVADPHGVVREGLNDLATADANMHVVGEASTDLELMDILQFQKTDVVVCDLTISPGREFETLARLRRDYPAIPLLVFTALPETEYGIRVLKSGAAGYLTKDSAPNEVLAAIKRVASGGKYVSPSLVELIADGVAETDRPPHQSLSQREYTIFMLFAAGWKNTEVGEKLGLSVKTIATYKTRILIKLKVETTAELIHYAMKQGLLKD